MTTNPLTKNYKYLTPEERFRLILAATGRGDDAEADRLARTGGRLRLSMFDHSPFAHAFQQLHLMTFLELLEESNGYIESLARARVAGLESDEQADKSGARESTSKNADIRKEKLLAGAMAAGFLLRSKIDGWTRFCEQMQIDPFRQWEYLPGYGRLKSAIDLAEEFAFTTGAFLDWLNSLRSTQAQGLTGVSAEEVAAEYEKAFRCSVKQWGG